MSTDLNLDLLCVGEALIDFVADRPVPRLEDVSAFRRAAGGAPANVAVAGARLGLRTGFLGRVGDDAFGRYLAEVLVENGVESRLRLDPVHQTGLAFVNLGIAGERSFEFFRYEAADLFLSVEDVAAAGVAGARILHFGSLSLAAEPCRTATLFAVKTARAAGREVSFDVNLRPALWPRPEEARSRILEALPLATILKVSEEEAAFLLPGESPASFCRWALGQGARLVAVTMGAEGSLLAAEGVHVEVPGFAVAAVDTTGAGDAFLAALLREALRSPLRTEAELRRAGRFANAVGALTVTAKGAIPALPTLRQAERLLRRHSPERGEG